MLSWWCLLFRTLSQWLTVTARLQLRTAVVAIAFFSAVNAPASSTLEDGAETVLRDYFAALRAGDVRGLRRLRGKEWGAQLAGSLDSSADQRRLRRIYGGAELEILEVKPIERGRVAVIVDFWLNDIEPKRYRFILADDDGTLRVVAEEPLSLRRR